MILVAKTVTGLQYFLLDAAKRYVVPQTGAIADASDLLAGAAALDYVLLLASQNETQTLDDASTLAAGVRETLARAGAAALDFIETTIVPAGPAVRADFRERHLKPGGIFEVLRKMREGGALRDDDVAFRKLTLASDLLQRIFERYGRARYGRDFGNR